MNISIVQFCLRGCDLNHVPGFGHLPRINTSKTGQGVAGVAPIVSVSSCIALLISRVGLFAGLVASCLDCKCLNSLMFNLGTVRLVVSQVRTKMGPPSRVKTDPEW
jgi:hypothetical protein